MKVIGQRSSFGKKAGDEYKPKPQEIVKGATNGGKCLIPQRNPKYKRLLVHKEPYANMEKGHILGAQ